MFEIWLASSRCLRLSSGLSGLKLYLKTEPGCVLSFCVTFFTVQIFPVHVSLADSCTVFPIWPLHKYGLIYWHSDILYHGLFSCMREFVTFQFFGIQFRSISVFLS